MDTDILMRILIISGRFLLISSCEDAAQQVLMSVCVCVCVCVRPSVCGQPENLPSTSFYNVQNVPVCSRTIQNVPKCSRMFQNVPECSRMFQKGPECSRRVQNVPEGSRMHAECSGMFQIACIIFQYACSYISLHAVT